MKRKISEALSSPELSNPPKRTKSSASTSLGVSVVCQRGDRQNLRLSTEFLSRASVSDNLVCGECFLDIGYRKAHSRQGYGVRSHFFHVSGDESRSCGGGESLIHRACKQWIIDNLQSTTFETQCSKCQLARSFGVGERPRIATAEYATPDRRYIIDVHVSASTADWAVEICHTHPIGQDKRKGLHSYVDGVCEISSQEIIACTLMESASSFRLVDRGMCLSCLRRWELPWCRANIPEAVVGDVFEHNMQQVLGEHKQGLSMMDALGKLSDYNLSEFNLAGVEMALASGESIQKGSAEDGLAIKLLLGEFSKTQKLKRVRLFRDLLAFYDQPKSPQKT